MCTHIYKYFTNCYYKLTVAYPLENTMYGFI